VLDDVGDSCDEHRLVGASDAEDQAGLERTLDRAGGRGQVVTPSTSFQSHSMGDNTVIEPGLARQCTVAGGMLSVCPPSIHACLSVWGSFDPADLTRLLGVEAKTRRAGDVRPGGRTEDDDLWHYSPTEDVAMLPGDTPNGTVSAAHVAEVASLGCELDIDLYCLPALDDDD
jgi:hypothetical protein